MGMIVSGSRTGEDECRNCLVLGFAPLTDRDAFVPVICDCGLIYGVDADAAEAYQRLRADGVSLEPDHWGDENAGGLVEILTVAKTAAEWVVLADSARRGLQFWRARSARSSTLTREEAVAMAIRAVVGQEVWLERDWIDARSVRWADGVAQVDLCHDYFEWTVEVRRVSHVVSYRIIVEPAWTPSHDHPRA